MVTKKFREIPKIPQIPGTSPKLLWLMRSNPHQLVGRVFLLHELERCLLAPRRHGRGGREKDLFFRRDKRGGIRGI